MSGHGSKSPGEAISLAGREAIIQFYADRDTDADPNRWFDVEKTELQVGGDGLVVLSLHMVYGSLVTVTWLPAKAGEGALDLARLIAA